MTDQIGSKLTHLPTYNTTNIPMPELQQPSAIRIIQPANGNPGPLGLFAFAVTTSTLISSLHFLHFYDILKNVFPLNRFSPFISPFFAQ
jgi:hypothetical protein